MTHKPSLPIITLMELEEINPEAFRAVSDIAYQYAKIFYKTDPVCRELGLEMNVQTILGLIDKGWVKILYNEETDDIFLGVFQPSIGEYVPIGAQEEQDELG